MDYKYSTDDIFPKLAKFCKNGYPYDESCDDCATNNLAGDKDHAHCFSRRIDKVKIPLKIHYMENLVINYFLNINN